MKSCLKYFICVFTLIYFPVLIQAQGNFSSEEELKIYAGELFQKEDYVKALPLYSQLLSLYPKDPNYNYRFGVCLLFSDADKEKPVKYLEYASSKEEVDPEVFFYLGRTYHLNYRFDDAIGAYHKFNQKGNSQSKSALRADRQIEMCNNGKKLVRNSTSLVVIEKKELKENDFYRSYALGDFGGKIIVKPEEFKTSADNRKKEKSILFLPDGPKEIFFASYGTNDKNGKDIYKVEKLANGEWSKPISLGAVINTPYDEDFPFLHPDGTTLYFCSKGHSSMGGYDIFKSILNKYTNTWSPPVNLNFPINSPDDDILFITDGNEKTAYFSSGRASIKGNILVYKIKIEIRPGEITHIKGKFISRDKSISISAKITVKNASDELVATAQPHPVTGNYLLNLPGAGKYNFIVESKGYPIKSEMAEIPGQKNQDPLKQEMELVQNATGVQLIIRDYISQESMEKEPALVLDSIKNQASLDVNYDPKKEEEKIIADAGEQKKESPLKDSPGNNPLNKNDKPDKAAEIKVENEPEKEIINTAHKAAENAKKEEAEIRKEVDFTYALAGKKREICKENLKESENAFAAAQNIADPIQRETALEKAAELKKQSDQLAREAVVSYNLAEKLENDANKKQEESGLYLQYAKELESAVDSNSSRDALSNFNIQKEKLEKGSLNAGSGTAVNTLKKESLAKQNEAEKARSKAQELKNQLPDINTEISNLKSEAEKTKDTSIKTELNNRISGLQEEHADIENQSDNQMAKASKLEKEAATLQNDANLMTDLIDKVKNTSESEFQYESPTPTQKEELKSQISELETQTQKADNEEQASNQIPEKTITPGEAIKDIPDNNQEKIDSPGKAENSGNVNAEISIVNEKGELYDYSSLYTDQLDKAELIEEAYQKEKTKESIYKNWSSSINKEIQYRKDKLENFDKKEKKAEKEKITALEALVKVKQGESEKNLAKSKELKNPEIALSKDNTKQQGETPNLDTASTETLVDNNVKKEEDKVVIPDKEIASESIGEIDYSITDEEKTETSNNKIETNPNVNNAAPGEEPKNKEKEVLPAPSSPASKDPVNKYSSNTAKTEKLKAENINKEEQELSNRAALIRTNASGIKDPEQRKSLLAEATALDKQSQEKKIEAAFTYAKANQSEYLYKESELSGLANANKNNKSDEAAVAVMLREEAQYYFNEAKNIRENAKAVENPISRVNSLNKANEFESLALDKQQKASDIYAKLPPVVISSVNDNNETVIINEKSASQNVERPDLSIIKNDPVIENKKRETVPLKELSKEENSPNDQKSENQEEESNELLKTTENNMPANVPDTSSVGNLEQPVKTSEKTEIPTREAEIARLNQLAKEEKSKAEQLKQEAQNLSEDSEKLSAQEENNKKKKAALQEQVRLKREEAIARQKEAEAAYKNAEKLQEELNALAMADSLNKNTNSNSPVIAETISPSNTAESAKEDKYKINTENKISVAVNADPTGKEKRREGSDSSFDTNSFSKTGNTSIEPKKHEIPLILTEEIFETTSVVVYNESNPIPLDVKLPEGLVFKVQVGAFRNKIPQDLFKGFAPIVGESTPQGFTRYTAGMFKSYKTAGLAKEVIKGYGYSDAFVVVFYNGKKISLKEAQVLIKSGVASTATDNIAFNEKNTESNITEGSTGKNIAAFKELGDFKGLLYTVQVGVFSKAVTSAQLFNIQPLYIEATASGFLRYTSGIYDNMVRASEAKSIVKGAGVKDAFVTAYYNGRRIPLGEAGTIGAANGSNVFVQSPNLNRLPFQDNGSVGSVTVVPKKEVFSADIAEKVPAIAVNKNSNADPDSVGITKNVINEPITKIDNPVQLPVFKVQIGAFREEVPIEIASIFLKIAHRGIDHYINEEGLTIYLLGTFPDYEAANQMKKELVEKEGLNGAFIVAYLNGKKMPVDEAQKLFNKK